MTFRAFLQIEIWSKRTTRKILAGIGIVVCVFVGGFGVLYEAERYWLTPGERSAARSVLAQLDSIQNLETIRRNDFEAKENGLQQKLTTARDAAWTNRDRGVYGILFVYLLITERERADVWEQGRMQDTGSSISGLDHASSWNKIAAEKKQLRFYRALLHKELD